MEQHLLFHYIIFLKYIFFFVIHFLSLHIFGICLHDKRYLFEGGYILFTKNK